MRSNSGWITRFWRDEKGAFATIFGILLIVVVATSGAVVDFVGVQQARTRAQLALDAATLALQPNIYTWSDADLIAAAENLVVERLGDTSVAVDVEAVETDLSEGSLYFRAKLNVPTQFVSLVNIPSMDVGLASQATQKKNRLEVAMVLDNSGSMANYSRLTNLKAAANNAVNILFDGQPTQPDVFIGVVPFNFFVNVGTSNATAPWLVDNGQSNVAWDNFDNDDDESTIPSGSLDRLGLFSSLNNVSWEGCVETRAYPYDTNDAEPVVSDTASLFVPAFQPDNPDQGGYSWNYVSDFGGSCDNSQYKGFCTKTSWTGRNSTPPGSSAELDPLTGPNQTGSNVCSCTGETVLSNSSYFSWTYGTVTTQTCQDWNVGFSLTPRELQERVCKYDGVNVSSTAGYQGPNSSCLDAPILPLTNTAATVTAAVDAMSADGGTNIHTGTAWGWRLLSDTEPFTGGVSVADGASKVMIVMTDGENTHYPTTSNMNGASYYTAYSFPWNERLGEWGDSTNQLQGEMNTRTLETCTNAKMAGIEIYTIGLNSPNSTTTNMLTNCATDPSYAYFPNAASELTGVFEDIANQLAQLRLAL